jgi:plastocyanin
MLGRRVMAVAAGVLLLGSTPLVVSSTASAQGMQVVNINGQDGFQANSFIINTFHFDQGKITVHHGDRVMFTNNTREGHNMTLVAPADLPRTAAQAFNCRLCGAVNGKYFPRPGPPAGVQIDNGVITDDKQKDADTLDPAVAPGPFNALIEDFDTVSHSNSVGPPTIGDSTLIGTFTQPGTPTSRTIVVTAPAGNVLHYYCTFHAWMQGSIAVIP